MVALVAGNVSERAAATLALDGWKVRSVVTVANPGLWSGASQKYPPRFWGVYTKLLIFNLTEYDRVVYLDADTILLRNADELFLCDGLCGVMRHSEKLNTGVLALAPDAALFADMMGRVASTPSYTGGDQGFLNEYFSEFPAAPFFDPRGGQALSAAAPAGARGGPRGALRLGRLPTAYNADLGLFITNSGRWAVRGGADEIRVLHYTLGTFKALRQRLKPTVDGYMNSEDRRQHLARTLLLALPWLLAAALAKPLWGAGLGAAVRGWAARLQARLARQRPGAGGSGANGCSSGCACGSRPSLAAESVALLMEGGPFSKLSVAAAASSYPSALPSLALAAGSLSLLTALGTAVLVVIPQQVLPGPGWCLAYEWTTLLFVCLYSIFLRACLWHGRRHGAATAAAADSDGAKGKGGGRWLVAGGRDRPWAKSGVLFALIVAVLGAIPSWTDILGVQALSARVVGTAVAGVVSAMACCLALISLAGSWHAAGKLEGAARSGGAGGCCCSAATGYSSSGGSSPVYHRAANLKCIDV
eukprot:scaffold3.g6489.t1